MAGDDITGAGPAHPGPTGEAEVNRRVLRPLIITIAVALAAAAATCQVFIWSMT